MREIHGCPKPWDDPAIHLIPDLPVPSPFTREEESLRGGTPSYSPTSEFTRSESDGIFTGLAHDMLVQAGYSSGSPKVIEALARHLENGVIDTLTGSPATKTDIKTGDPAKHFFDMAEQGLSEGTLMPRLEAAIAAQESEALKTQRAGTGESPVKLSREKRNLEIGQLLPQTYDTGSLAVAAFRQKDDVTLHMRSYANDPKVVTDLIRGTVKGFETIETRPGLRLEGAVLEVKQESRTSPDLFSSPRLLRGAEVILAGTMLPNGYIQRAGQIAMGQTPVLFWGNGQLRIRTMSEYLMGVRDLPLSQLSINGINLFREQ